MWVFHRGDRRRIFNIDAYQEIVVEGNSILLLSSSGAPRLSYETEKEAQQAFTYLLESIKRGDKLAHL